MGCFVLFFTKDWGEAQKHVHLDNMSSIDKDIEIISQTPWLNAMKSYHR